MRCKTYPSDLTDAQWRLIARLIPDAKPGGRPREYDMREVVDGLLYLAREGCSWRPLPHDLPHWKTCYSFLRSFQADGTWDALVTALRVEVRAKLGRDSDPGGACIDGQSAKTASGGAKVGVDGGKLVWGRERHIVTDTLGLLRIVVVTAANVDDGAAAPRLLAGLPATRFPRLTVIWADNKYRNRGLDRWLAGQDRLRLEATGRAEGRRGSSRCPSDGWWSRPSGACCDGVGWCATSRGCRRRARRWSSWPRSTGWPAVPGRRDGGRSSATNGRPRRLHDPFGTASHIHLAR